MAAHSITIAKKMFLFFYYEFFHINVHPIQSPRANQGSGLLNEVFDMNV